MLTGILIGLAIGLTIGAAGMYCMHARAVDEYVQKTLEEMREWWQL